MKELVCIAPDGTLEVWSQVIANIEFPKLLLFKIEYYAPYDKDQTYWTICSCTNNPSFWGREVLGEL